MTSRTIEIGIIDYPGAMQSALHGLKEMFSMANMINAQSGEQQNFAVELYDISTIGRRKSPLQVIIIPPNIEGEYCFSSTLELKDWIKGHHKAGAIICSVCAGAFILADTGLLQNRQATTHWGLALQFSKQFPDIKLDINKILINDGDIITAAGLMSWVDLGLELVAQFMHPNIMRLLGKSMIVDTGLREQRYYQSFSPKLDHGDQAILKAQHYLQQHFHEGVTTATLSSLCILTGRTFLRRFVKATGLKPTQYLQRLRIQEACNLVETTNGTFEFIALKVGYEDSSAFRKTFLKIVGLTPREFKGRFAAR